MKPKRYYSKEFKLQASAMAEERENVTQAARELHIRPNMPRRWIREYNGNKTEAFKGRAHAAKLKDKKLSELQALKKELREVKLERDILKKAVHIFSNSDRTGLGSLSSMPIAILLRRCAKCFGLLFLRKHPISQRVLRNRALLSSIKQVYKANRETYGPPRITK